MSDPPTARVRRTWYAGPDSWQGELWTMLHLPYTGMVLAFVVLGASLSPTLSWPVLLATLSAYFLALGIGSHFLDQLPGMGSRYVRHWPSWALGVVGTLGVTGGVVIGAAGAVVRLGPWFLVLVAAQGTVAVGYPLAPKFAGLLHRDSVFAISWGALPFLISFYAQSRSITIAALLVGASLALVAVVEIRASRASREARRRGAVQPSHGVAGRPTPGRRRPELVLQALVAGSMLAAAASLALRVASGG
ncbi:MAG: hypothetical protein L3J87_02650 [Thermoplasmata archaeon]|nr:hypothetical protein [Thermoplasmata archaeon]